ncbi:MAG TPA: hypothetical protein VGD05_03655 [Pyrinomonadaceae bacterium]
MEAVITQLSLNNNAETTSPNTVVTDFSAEKIAAPDLSNAAFELGLWLSGLESFLNIRNHSFADENRSTAASRDWTKEFRLIHATLLLCSKLNFQLGKNLRKNNLPQTETDGKDTFEGFDSVNKESEITAEDAHKFSIVLKDSILLNESLLRAAPLRFGEWTAWCAFLSERLESADGFKKLVKMAEKSGEEFLPEILRKLLESRSFAGQTDLQSILPRFAVILKWLSVVETMLEKDEPLKPTLLIFARVYEQVQEMITFINNRLLRFPNEENPLFASLDGAAYTASLELKKVYNQELVGLVGIRPTPSVYAKIETACALLNHSFQQTLVGFAQLIEPNIEPHKIFPSFQVRFEQSKILRLDLWNITKAVKAVERKPEKQTITELNERLTAFLNNSMHFLFYKDKETVERFVEEILVTTDKKDLVPILHRFGAYLETLFGQVNMRTVLANYPFQPKE